MRAQHCPKGGGEQKTIGAILQAPAIERILAHLGLQARASPRAPGRGKMRHVVMAARRPGLL